MNEKLEGILFEYDLGETKAIMAKLEKESTLEQMYKLIDCSSVDCVSLPKNIDIWTDDEGLLKSDSAVIHYVIRENDESDGFELHLAGKSLFLSTDEDGNTIGLSNEQIDWVQKNVRVGLYCFKK